MVDLRELQVFIAAAETENLSAAARRLGVSQPAISFRVKCLEEKLKVQLFARVGRRVMLTNAGRELLPLACELVALSAGIEETVKAQQDSRRGQLQIACGTWPARYVLPQLLGAFGKRFPRVLITCRPLSFEMMDEGLRRGELHFGVVARQVKGKRVVQIPLFWDELVLIAGASHPWAERGQIAPGELRGADWLLDTEDPETRDSLLATLPRDGATFDGLRVALETGDPETLLSAAETGQGVAVVSERTARDRLEHGRIRRIRIDGVAPIGRAVFLTYCRARTETVPRRFLEFIESDEGQCLVRGTERERK
jgi:DNA-binding transcriptional LysR family regulator